MPKTMIILLLAAFCACQKSSEPEQKQDDTKEEGLAFPGLAPPEVDQVELPGPQGPFVEPPLLERPRDVHHVVAGYPKDLVEARKLAGRLAGLQAVPVGYPSVDQAQGLGKKGSRWVVLAGKFARKGYAQRLLEVVKKAGFSEAALVTRRYLHDRFRPAINQAEGFKVGRVFAGMTGMQVPLLRKPSSAAPGTGAMIDDGVLVKVAARHETGEGIWFRVRTGESEGYLPAARLLVDYNVFPSPNGRRAVLGAALGCQAGKCRWDYWMVGRDFTPRKMLAAAAERLPHAFSPDGSVLAYTSVSMTLTLAFEDKDSEVGLGSGTSPSWASGGNLVYFRRPGLNEMRDEVMAASAPDWKVHEVLDFGGQPHYPKALSVIPPAVDILEGGGKLYTMFYRLVRRDGGMAIHRWKVLFNPEGKIISKKGEQITE